MFVVTVASASAYNDLVSEQIIVILKQLLHYQKYFASFMSFISTSMSRNISYIFALFNGKLINGLPLRYITASIRILMDCSFLDVSSISRQLQNYSVHPGV